MLGVTIAAIGISAFQAYQNQQLAKKQAAAQKREAARQASYANLEGAADARVKAATLAASTGGKSGGSTVSGGMFGVYSEIAAQGRELSASTDARIAAINLENRYTQKAAALGFIADTVEYSSPLIKSWTTPGDTGAGDSGETDIMELLTRT